MAATRRKAAHDLDKIPSDEGEWRAAARKYGLQSRNLEDLCKNGNFSASTVPTEAFLTLRCVWPKKEDYQHAVAYIANREHFFNWDNVDDAKKLMDKQQLGLDKLMTLYQIICLPKQSLQRTPPEFSGTLADGLGPFSLLVPIYNQLQDRRPQTPSSVSYLENAPRGRPFFDAFHHQGHQVPTSPTRHGAAVEDIAIEDIQMTGIDIGSFSSSLPEDAMSLAEHSVVSVPIDEPLPRTPTETLVTDFAVILLGGLASLVQPLGYKPLCMANSFETTYEFGPLNNVSNPLDKVKFRARIDGSIPFSVSPGKDLREAIIFEAKRAPRVEGINEIPVLAQQSMEHAAYIWNRHKEDTTWKNSAQKYYTFMVAQDHLSFHISIGTYDHRYLDYIFASNSRRVIPAQGSIPFLQIQEFGPFDAENEDHLPHFLLIILSFILSQLEKTAAAAIFKDALR
ncbi:hypothetical protein GTR04_5377 [Trichophyton interdigitale]|uniref:Uncharacterized protein n=1 Tax=Trichophyton interdigitale (strain MR816) TaxID=1215338 RepID=A0A059JDE6_TRIIM|nr:hypothetical protein H101_06929 [Trichophyton interdigitale H6]KAG5210058.1 hypothetical protein GY631_5181 [Trichophyton interdigitale]KAG5218849.1 hypothetical protein GY632_5135 [Trichophyton interdigitale]KAG8207245.1 hypothetical protein GTR04_5377 [Trichophyton interdigitale]KDB25809.1 hypothetical protein H109_02379 [Trichophyton interdigitale MR816]